MVNSTGPLMSDLACFAVAVVFSGLLLAFALAELLAFARRTLGFKTTFFALATFKAPLLATVPVVAPLLASVLRATETTVHLLFQQSDLAFDRVTVLVAVVQNFLFFGNAVLRSRVRATCFWFGSGNGRFSGRLGICRRASGRIGRSGLSTFYLCTGP